MGVSLVSVISVLVSCNMVMKSSSVPHHPDRALCDFFPTMYLNFIKRLWCSRHLSVLYIDDIKTVPRTTPSIKFAVFFCSSIFVNYLFFGLIKQIFWSYFHPLCYLLIVSFLLQQVWKVLHTWKLSNTSSNSLKNICVRSNF